MPEADRATATRELDEVCPAETARLENLTAKMDLGWAASTRTPMGEPLRTVWTQTTPAIRPEVQAKGIDLTQLDFAVISHRHGDHTSGLNHLLKVNPGVKIHAPQENFGGFGASLPGTFYRREESLPAEMRYYDGKAPETLRFGTPWPEGNFTWVIGRPAQ